MGLLGSGYPSIIHAAPKTGVPTNEIPRGLRHTQTGPHLDGGASGLVDQQSASRQAVQQDLPPMILVLCFRSKYTTPIIKLAKHAKNPGPIHF